MSKMDPLPPQEAFSLGRKIVIEHNITNNDSSMSGAMRENYREGCRREYVGEGVGLGSLA